MEALSFFALDWGVLFTPLMVTFFPNRFMVANVGDTGVVSDLLDLDAEERTEEEAEDGTGRARNFFFSSTSSGVCGHAVGRAAFFAEE